jgi:CheY-like chemotaxis protein
MKSTLYTHTVFSTGPGSLKKLNRRSLLRWSVQDNLKPFMAAVDTQTVLTEVFQQYLEPARSRGIALRISVRRHRPPPIESDRSLFKRALSNFVLNAIKNTFEGGVVIGWVEIGDRIRIDVRDTGAGIAPAHGESIFAEYYQVNNPGRDRSKGLGLGLSIVHRVFGILPKHGMSFWSAEGRGSRFSLYAPISDMAPVTGTDDQRSAASTSVLRGRYVLLCDDEPTVLEGLRRLFLSAGALVDTAESMTGFETILADDGRIPDIIVTDIRLRDGPTGIDLFQTAAQKADTEHRPRPLTPKAPIPPLTTPPTQPRVRTKTTSTTQTAASHRAPHRAWTR